MGWTIATPVSGTRIIDIPSIHSGNWTYLENYLNVEHYGPNNSLSGHHRPGMVSLVFQATSAVVGTGSAGNPLSAVAPESGAMSHLKDYGGAYQVYDGSKWKLTSEYLPHTRIFVHPAADVALTKATTAIVPCNTEVEDILGEWNTTTYSFKPCADGYYLYHAMFLCSFKSRTSISAEMWVRTSAGTTRFYPTTTDLSMTTDPYPVQNQGIIPLSAGDVVKFYLRNDSTLDGVLQGTKTDSYIYIYRLS